MLKNFVSNITYRAACKTYIDIEPALNIVDDMIANCAWIHGDEVAVDLDDATRVMRDLGSELFYIYVHPSFFEKYKNIR